MATPFSRQMRFPLNLRASGFSQSSNFIARRLVGDDSDASELPVHELSDLSPLAVAIFIAPGILENRQNFVAFGAKLSLRLAVVVAT